jgi:hypothetical protein
MNDAHLRGARLPRFELSERQKRALFLAPLLGGILSAALYVAVQLAFGASVSDAAWVAIAFAVPAVLIAYLVELIVVPPLLGLFRRHSWRPTALSATLAGALAGGCAGAILSVLGSRVPHIPALSAVAIGGVVGIACALPFWFLTSDRQGRRAA